MAKFTLFHFYLIFFIVGLGYTVIAFLLGQLGGGHDVGGHEADVDAGGDFGHELSTTVEHEVGHAGGHDVAHDVDHDFGHDVGHDVAHGADAHHDLSHGHDVGDADLGEAMPNISPLSPVTIATFITSFGGVGIILYEFHLPGLLSLPVAGSSGFVIAGGVFYLFYRLFSATQGSSDVSVRHVIGRQAEVITAIPSNGLGEIAYVLGGRRFNVAARTEDGRPLAHGANVIITQLKNGRYYVTESAAEKLKQVS